ncbi:MAG: VWA domain-containing protein [Anaerolineae bacterium]|nr:VWA domain-containing protein [Anaerolineae bacterium]
MADELKLSTSLNKASVPVTRTQQLLYVLIEALPSNVVSQTRMSLNFGFVLDRSGSMRGKKVERLKEAVALALGRMAPDDLVSVTIFSDQAQVIAKGGARSDQDVVIKKIQSMHAGGGTQMSRGLSLGLREVYRQFAAERVNQVLLLTDGQTYGDEEACLKLAREAGEHKIAIQALGLGDDWNEDLLDQIGQLSSGGSDLIESADEIVPLFTQTVERSQKAVVRNAELVLRLVSGVVPRQVWQITPLIENLGYRPIGEHDVQLQLGELDAEQGKSLLVELIIPPRRPGRYRLAQAEVRYDLPQQGLRGSSARSDVVVEYSADPAQIKGYDARIMNLAEKVTAYKLQTRALEEARMGNLVGATQKLRAAATRLLDLGEMDLAAAAQEEANNLEQSGQMSASGTKKLRYQTRKLTQRLPDLPDDV